MPKTSTRHIEKKQKLMHKIYYKKLFSRLGVSKGDMLYVASNILPLILNLKKNKINFNANQLINDLQELIGKNGTLLFPTYNWDFCKKKTFNYLKTPSKCGALSNIVLQRKDFKRTNHPIYSLAVWGKHKAYLCKLKNKSSWGKGSPFDFMFKKACKNIFIGVDYKNAFTMDHYFEQKVNVNYRYNKTFTSNYVDKYGKKKLKSYTMFVRKENLCKSTKISRLLDAKLLKNKSLKKLRFKNVLFSLINIKDTSKIIITDLKKNNSKLIFPVNK